jgi:DNA invertase Pin-like site-specific DNA recombinase
MLTIAYCRVSTEEQAAEGFSIEGQADKLRAYAALHDLGDVVDLEQTGDASKFRALERLRAERVSYRDIHVRALILSRL